jgi:UDP-2-acetamido-3-amino-2,3-dideoxy-glucuronate N-acetyltransferase
VSHGSLSKDIDNELYLHQQIADVTTTHLNFPSGLQAHIFVSWLHPFKEQKLVVVGGLKMAVFDHTKPWEDKLILYAHQINWKNNLPVPTMAEGQGVDVPQEEPLGQECRHFLDCISNGNRPVTDGHEGLRVLKILNASQASLNDNGRIIELGFESDADIHAATSVDGSAKSSIQSAEAQGAFVHPTSIVDEKVKIGRGTEIWHFSYMLSNSKIGENCNIGQNVVIGPSVDIGEGCKIQNNVSVFKGITLEDVVFCGSSMFFYKYLQPAG